MCTIYLHRNLFTPNNRYRSNDMKNSLTQNDLKCGMIAYEVNKMCIRTVMFVSDVYTHSGMGSRCIDYKSFYRNGDNVVLSDYVESGFLKDHNIGASYNENYWFSDYYSARDYFDSIRDKDFRKYNYYKYCQ